MRKLCLASAQPLRILPRLEGFSAAAAPGSAALAGRATGAATGAEGFFGAGADTCWDSNPQRMQRTASPGIRLLHFGQRFIATPAEQD